ncbi:hypothetical protein V3C99_009076 [Haemonchus contortus]
MLTKRSVVSTSGSALAPLLMNRSLVDGSVLSLEKERSKHHLEVNTVHYRRSVQIARVEVCATRHGVAPPVSQGRVIISQKSQQSMKLHESRLFRSDRGPKALMVSSSIGDCMVWNTLRNSFDLGSTTCCRGTHMVQQLNPRSMLTQANQAIHHSGLG